MKDYILEHHTITKRLFKQQISSKGLSKELNGYYKSITDDWMGSKCPYSDKFFFKNPGRPTLVWVDEDDLSKADKGKSRKRGRAAANVKAAAIQQPSNKRQRREHPTENVTEDEGDNMIEQARDNMNEPARDNMNGPARDNMNEQNEDERSENDEEEDDGAESASENDQNGSMPEPT